MFSVIFYSKFVKHIEFVIIVNRHNMTFHSLNGTRYQFSVFCVHFIYSASHVFLSVIEIIILLKRSCIYYFVHFTTDKMFGASFGFFTQNTNLKCAHCPILFKLENTIFVNS